jgi:multiple sugar transport system permease protein
MTSLAVTTPKGARSKWNRRLRGAGKRTGVSLLVGFVCFIFILPLIYAVSVAFTPSDTTSIVGAPPWPVAARQFAYTDPQTKQTSEYYIYTVPDWDGLGKGHTKDLALITQNFPPVPSVFVDPANPSQTVKWGSKPNQNVYQLSHVWDVGITLDNFGTAWDKMGAAEGGFPLLFRNTLIIAILGTIGAVASAVIVAYGFARFRIPGKDLLFLILISTIMIPFQVTLIPTFLVFQAIGWTGTWLPLIVPHFFANAYNVFLLRQYFMGLPRELDEAAQMDGASPLRILISVIIPQSWPAIMAVTLFHFFFAWNDFLNPLIYLSGSQELWPIAVGLNNFNTTFRNAGTPAVIQAGSILAMLLPVVIFFFSQRVFMRGVVISGVEK